MPNHIHGIIFIIGTGGGEASADMPYGLHKSAAADASPGQLDGTAPGSLGAIIQNFKSVSSRKINQAQSTRGIPVWQRDYYERIIRDEAELNRIRHYIRKNPVRWAADQEKPSAR